MKETNEINNSPPETTGNEKPEKIIHKEETSEKKLETEKSLAENAESIKDSYEIHLAKMREELQSLEKENSKIEELSQLIGLDNTSREKIEEKIQLAKNLAVIKEKTKLAFEKASLKIKNIMRLGMAFMMLQNAFVPGIAHGENLENTKNPTHTYETTLGEDVNSFRYKIFSEMRKIAIYDNIEFGWNIAISKRKKLAGSVDVLDAQETKTKGEANEVISSSKENKSFLIKHQNPENIELYHNHTHPAESMGFPEKDLEKIEKGEITGYINPPSFQDIEDFIRRAEYEDNAEKEIVIDKNRNTISEKYQPLKNRYREEAIDPFGAWEYSYNENSENKFMLRLTTISEDIKIKDYFYKSITDDDIDLIINTEKKFLGKLSIAPSKEPKTTEEIAKKIVKELGDIIITLSTQKQTPQLKSLVLKMLQGVEAGYPRNELQDLIFGKYKQETKEYVKIMISNMENSIASKKGQETELEKLRFYKKVGVIIKYTPLNKPSKNSKDAGYLQKAIDENLIEVVK